MSLLAELFVTFFKIGLFTIGGGYAMIPLIEQEVVSKGWISLPLLTDFIGISESTPGPFAVNIATFIGVTSAGLPGALLATLGVVLPSFIIILVIAKYFHHFKDNFYVKRTMRVLRPATLGLVASAVYLIFSASFINADYTNGAFNITGAVILALLFFIRFRFKKIHPVAIIGISAGLGVLLFGLFP
jgi:chromate transporter